MRQYESMKERGSSCSSKPKPCLESPKPTFPGWQGDIWWLNLSKPQGCLCHDLCIENICSTRAVFQLKGSRRIILGRRRRCGSPAKMAALKDLPIGDYWKSDEVSRVKAMPTYEIMFIFCWRLCEASSNNQSLPVKSSNWV